MLLNRKCLVRQLSIRLCVLLVEQLCSMNVQRKRQQGAENQTWMLVYHQRVRERERAKKERITYICSAEFLLSTARN